MSEELTYVGEDKPLTAIEVRGQVNLIQEVMKSVMQEGQHYGKIPGAGDKPTLLKPGAEKIMATFRLSVDPEVEDLSVNDRIRYRVKCRLLWPSGRFAGAGVGEASTDEEKYRWRAVISEDEWNATPETCKRIKFRRDGQVKQIRTNPADLANTVLKMAKKRSLVDAVLTVTAASDIFTQDIEDMPSELLQGQQKPPLKEPQKKANGEVKPQEPTEVQVLVKDVTLKTGKGDKGEWTLYKIITADDLAYQTFNKDFGEIAVKEKSTRMPIIIEFKPVEFKGKDGKTIQGKEIVSLTRAEALPPEKDEIPF